MPSGLNPVWGVGYKYYLNYINLNNFFLSIYADENYYNLTAINNTIINAPWKGVSFASSKLNLIQGNLVFNASLLLSHYTLSYANRTGPADYYKKNILIPVDSQR